MKMNVKVMVAAVAMSAVTGQAYAAIANFATGNGELFFSVRDTATNTSYVRDLGITMDDWIASAGNSNHTFAADPTMTSYLNGKDPSQFVWAIMAGDSIGETSGAPGSLRYLTSATYEMAELRETQMDFNTMDMAGLDENYVNMVNAEWNESISPETIALNKSNTATSADTWYFMDLYDNWGGALNKEATAGVGQEMNFFLISNTDSLANQSNFQQFGKWNLDPTGNLTYTAADAGPGPAPIPVPAAVWLMGSALVGLVGVARRKIRTA